MTPGLPGRMCPECERCWIGSDEPVCGMCAGTGEVLPMSSQAGLASLRHGMDRLASVDERHARAVSAIAAMDAAYARTAERLAAAYSAWDLAIHRTGLPLRDWEDATAAATAELDSAPSEYRQVRDA